MRRRRGSRASVEFGVGVSVESPSEQNGLADLAARQRAQHIIKDSLDEILVPRKKKDHRAQGKQLAVAWADMTEEERARYLHDLSSEEKATMLAAMSQQERAALLASMSPSDRAAILAEMSPDERLSAPSILDDLEGDPFQQTMVSTSGLSRSERFKAARRGEGADYGGTRAMLSTTMEWAEDHPGQPRCDSYPVVHPNGWIPPSSNAQWPLDAKYLAWCAENALDPHDHKARLMHGRMKFGFGWGSVTSPAVRSRSMSLAHLERLAATKSLAPPRRSFVQYECVSVNPMQFQPEFDIEDAASHRQRGRSHSVGAHGWSSLKGGGLRSTKSIQRSRSDHKQQKQYHSMTRRLSLNVEEVPRLTNEEGAVKLPAIHRARRYSGS